MLARSLLTLIAIFFFFNFEIKKFVMKNKFIYFWSIGRLQPALKKAVSGVAVLS